MSTLVALQEAPIVRESPLTKRLNEAVWQAWLAKGKAHERRSHNARMKAVKWVAIAGLLVAAGVWPLPTPYAVVVRFIVTMGAMFGMILAFQGRRYTVAVIFATLVLLYNPVAPLLSFSSDWHRAGVLASAAPFFLLLAERKTKHVGEHHY